MMGNEAGDDQERRIHRESHKLGKVARTGAAASVVGPAPGENAATVLCHPLLMCFRPNCPLLLLLFETEFIFPWTSWGFSYI